MDTRGRPAGVSLQRVAWIAHRLAAALVIGAGTGFVGMFSAQLIYLLQVEPDHMSGEVPTLFVISLLFGASFGAVLGFVPAFLVLVSVLKRFSPWRLFLPLSLSASCTLALTWTLARRFLPDGYVGAQSVSSLALSTAGAAVGGIAASLLVRAYPKGHRSKQR